MREFILQKLLQKCELVSCNSAIKQVFPSKSITKIEIHIFTLLHSEWPKLYGGSECKKIKTDLDL